MTDPEKILFKNKLKRAGLAIIEQRIATTKESMDQAQQAANQEGKSSAGDKYETARAMGHLQKDMHTRQLVEHLKELAALHEINADVIYPSAGTGAFITCEGISFFIAAGLGKQKIGEHTIFFLSPIAPLARILDQKKAGDSFLFNSLNTLISEVF